MGASEVIWVIGLFFLGLILGKIFEKEIKK